MRGTVQCAFKAEPVQEGVRHVLREVQVRATWNFRQQGALWHVLYGHDHSWQQDQVPLSLTLTFQVLLSL